MNKKDLILTFHGGEGPPHTGAEPGTCGAAGKISVTGGGVLWFPGSCW